MSHATRARELEIDGEKKEDIATDKNTEELSDEVKSNFVVDLLTGEHTGAQSLNDVTTFSTVATQGCTNLLELVDNEQSSIDKQAARNQLQVVFANEQEIQEIEIKDREESEKADREKEQKAREDEKDNPVLKAQREYNNLNEHYHRLLSGTEKSADDELLIVINEMDAKKNELKALKQAAKRGAVVRVKPSPPRRTAPLPLPLVIATTPTTPPVSPPFPPVDSSSPDALAQRFEVMAGGKCPSSSSSNTSSNSTGTSNISTFVTIDTPIGRRGRLARFRNAALSPTVNSSNQGEDNK